MPRMTPCPSCHGHVLLGDRKCPHCGAALRTTTAGCAPAVLLGLALTGCPSGEDDTSGETMTSVTVGASNGTTDGSATAEITATVGAADYGTADPFPDDDSNNDDNNDTTASVPETTTGVGSSGGSGSGSSSSGSGSGSGSDSSGTDTSTTG